MGEFMDEFVKEKIFDFAYTMAFRDATMRRAFSRREGESDEELQQRKNEIKKHSNLIVRNYIDSILLGDESVHKKIDPFSIIESLCDEENTNRGFTFGNAQKLVNMTAKYMFLSTYADPEKRELYKDCHCPMDGFMMEWVKNHRDDYGLPLLKFKKSWSQIMLDDIESLAEYERFQDCIKLISEKEGIFPLEVDFKYWDE